MVSRGNKMHEPNTFLRCCVRRRLLAVATVLTAMGVLAFAVQAKINHSADNPAAAILDLRSASEAFAAIGQAVSPAVVSIQVERTFRRIASNQFLPGRIILAKC